MLKQVLLVAALAVVLAAPAQAAQPLPVSFHTATAAGQQIAMPAGSTSYTWTGATFAPGIPITELVASWNASTPDGSWIQVQMPASSREAGSMHSSASANAIRAQASEKWE